MMCEQRFETLSRGDESITEQRGEMADSASALRAPIIYKEKIRLDPYLASHTK